MSCFDALKVVNENLHKYVLAKRDAFMKEGLDEKTASHKAIDEFKNETVNSLADIHNQLADKRGESHPFPTPSAPVSDKVHEDNYTVGDMLDKTGLYNGKRGMFLQDGQTVIFKVNGENKEYELGNINDVKDKPINDFNITHEQSAVTVNDNNNFVIRGKEYVNPFEGSDQNSTDVILYDKDGNVVNVRMKTTDGERRTFTGNVAEDLAYQINLKEINKDNESTRQFEQYINDTPEVRQQIDDAGLPKTTEASATENNGEVSREAIPTIEPPTVTIETNTNEHTNNTEDNTTDKQSQQPPKTESQPDKSIPETPPPTGDGKEAATGSGENKVTSIQNSVVDEERQKRGLAPAMQAARKEFPKTWDEAMRHIEKNPNAGEELVTELKNKARPLTDVENAILLHRQITVQNQYDKVNQEINKAAESGDKNEVERNRLRIAGLSDMLQDIYNVGKSAGTEQGRGLATRAMLAKDDFTLAAMETKKRAANNGRPLTDEERTHIAELSKKIADLEEKVAKMEEEAALKPPKEKTKKSDKQFKDEREKILNDIKAKLKKARGETSAVIIPYAKELIAIAPDVAKLVKSLVEQGVTKLADVVDSIYEDIKDHIPDLTKDDVKDIVTGKYDQPKEAKKLSPEQEKAKIELERNKKNFKSELEKDRKANAGALEKGLNMFVRVERAFKLSSPITIAKLFMAAAYRAASTPIEEGIGGLITPLLPKGITNEAYGEAGFNAKAEARAYTKMVTKGMKDAWDTMNLKKGGKSDLEVLYGKEGTDPPELLDFFGHLHGAMKAPIKRAQFERSMEKRTANMIKNGVDVNDPLVATSIALSSYADAKRAIFMQDNAVSDWWQKHLIGSPKDDYGKVRAALVNFLVPFVKIPTNIVGETATYTAGTLIGAGKLARAFYKGMENLTPDEKDSILRCLKKGSIGAGFLLLGYLNPQAIGGYYTGKRKDQDVSVGGLRIFGWDVPQFLVHNPLMETLQIGATVRRVADTYVNGKSDEKKGVGIGILKASIGLFKELPFVSEAGELNKLVGTDQDRKDFLGEMMKNTLEPALLQSIAKYTDDGTKRKPETIMEHLEMGIPGLREKVGAKHSYTKSDYNNPVFKYFTDKGMALPYSSERTITIKDNKTGQIKKLSDYPEEIKAKYYDTKKKYLAKELGEIKTTGHVYVNKFGEISENWKDGESEIRIDDLSRTQLAKVLNIAAVKATKETKQELFK